MVGSPAGSAIPRVKLANVETWAHYELRLRLLDNFPALRDGRRAVATHEVELDGDGGVVLAVHEEEGEGGEGLEGVGGTTPYYDQREMLFQASSLRDVSAVGRTAIL